jgi:hypothetical protein
MGFIGYFVKLVLCVHAAAARSNVLLPGRVPDSDARLYSIPINNIIIGSA